MVRCDASSNTKTQLATELLARAKALTASDDADFALSFEGGMPPRLLWRGALREPKEISA